MPHAHPESNVPQIRNDVPATSLFIHTFSQQKVANTVQAVQQQNQQVH